jgi:adenylate cyclase
VGQLYDATQTHKLFEGLSRPTAEETTYTDEWGETLSGYAPVLTPDGHSLAVVGVDVTAERIDRLKRDVLATTLLSFGVAATLIGIASVMVSRNVQGPLSKIIRASSGIAEGHLEVRANLTRRDEFGILGRHFDQMAEGLQERERIRDTFGRYVSPEVVRRVLALKDNSLLGGVEREVTVVISDLRNYSTVSEQLTPQEVIGLINEYLAGMNEVIDAHGGTIIEFLGDAILCVFNAPSDQPDHAEQAVRCALGMRERLVQLNVEWEKRGLSSLWKERGVPDLTARIGIHTGQVVAGNLGSPRHMKYAVIGDSVNVAARCEALNKELGTEILITDAVYERLPRDLRGGAHAHGAHQVKGREQRVNVYSV